MNIDEFEKHRIELLKPLLLIRTPAGLLACGYLNVETFNKTGEACAIVTGVNTYDDMLDARVVSVSAAASDLGVVSGMLGRDALQMMDTDS